MRNLGVVSGKTEDGRTVIDQDPSHHFGAVEGPAVHLEKFVKAVGLPVSDQELCAEVGKPTELTFRYTGGGPDATMTHQAPDKYSVTGDPEDALHVQVLVTDNADAAKGDAKIFMSLTPVDLNGEFTAKSINGGRSEFPAGTYIHLFSEDGTVLLQTVKYHASCSTPIVLGDITGGVTLVGVVGQSGSAMLEPQGNSELGVSIANAAQAPIFELGTEILFTYVVSNPGSEPVDAVMVLDDNYTPNDLGDDFEPAAVVDNDGFNVGDLNQNNILDTAEKWLYQVTDVVEAEGSYCNVATVVTSVVDPVSDTACYQAVLPPIDVCSSGEKPQVLILEYTGGETVSNSQDGKAQVLFGGNINNSPVTILATDNSNPDKSDAKIFSTSGLPVEEGYTFFIDSRPSKNTFPSTIYLHISDEIGNLLQSVSIHTSCSQVLALGDQFGAVRLVGFIGEHGASLGVQTP